MTPEQQINLAVEKLLVFLQQNPTHIAILKAEKEGWVEYQLSEWLAKQLQDTYGFDIWDLGFYFGIDIYVKLLTLVESSTS